ncbi:MAG: hypothetical protein ACRDCJ_03055 [Metamycoplasmataceae bacterium]
MDKSENYRKLLEKFKIFIKDNCDLGDLLYSSSTLNHSFGSIFGTYQNNVKKFIDKEKIVDPHKIIMAFIEELEIGKFLIIKEQEQERARNDLVSIERKITKSKEIIKKYYVSYKFFSSESNLNKIFFAREFGNNETKNFYDMLKKKIESELKLPVVMLEDDPLAGNIHSRIKNEIKNCKYFIADLTFKKFENKKDNPINANVMYEIGMAHAYDKPALLIMHESVYPFESEDKNIKLPFDITSHTTMKYIFDDENTIKSILDCIKSGLN